MENNSMTLLTDLINDADFIYMNTNEDARFFFISWINLRILEWIFPQLVQDH